MSLFRFILFVSGFVVCLSAQAESTRINVYSLTEKFYDTQTGDTLFGITQQLLPNNPALQKTLADDILQRNPGAFIDNNPAALRANNRLNLPVYTPPADNHSSLKKTGPNQIESEKTDPEKTSIESFSWGSIKRPLPQKN